MLTVMYTVTPVTPVAYPYPPYSSTATGINASGQITGLIKDDLGELHGFLDSAGTTALLGVLPGDGYSYPHGVNDSGQVVGVAPVNLIESGDAFLYSGGMMQDLGTLPGGESSGATGINDSGQVVGWSDSATGAMHFCTATA